MRLLRLALEEAGLVPALAPEEPTLVMKGPLAEIYSQALNVAYAKADPLTGETGIGLETQANDSLTAQAALLQEADAENAVPATVTIFGASRSDLTPETVVDLTQAIGERPSETGVADFYLILDATRPGPNSDLSGAPQERMVQLATEGDTVDMLEASTPIPAALVETPALADVTSDGVSETVQVEGTVAPVEAAPVATPTPAEGGEAAATAQAEAAPEAPVEEVAVVLDIAKVGEVSTEALAAAMECLVECHGGKVFRSIAEYQAFIAKK